MIRQQPTMHITALPPSQLTPAHRAAWQRLRASAGGLDNPFFALDFYTLLEEVRGGIEIAVVEQDGREIAFVPLERHGRVAKTGGSFVSEIHGPIADEHSAWTPSQVVQSLGLQGWQFRCVPAVHSSLEPYYLCRRNFSVIDLTGGLECYFKQRKAAGSDQIDQVRRKARKFERDHGPLRFEWHTHDNHAMERLMQWKSQQYRDTRTVDMLAVKWVVELLERLRRRAGEETRGVLSVLYWDQRVLAVHLGLLGDGIMSWWFTSYDREFARYSPGSILLLRHIEAAAEQGVRRIDLGQGDERYKRSFANAGFEVAEGAVDTRIWRRAMHGAWIQAREWAQASPVCRQPLRLFRSVRNRFITSAEYGA